ncbi:2-hydroxyacid dehydrogenase [Lachnoclostridium sp. Marseille-P6806]|uniref:2-hydroxyacid dehydrogenase n=1 Tax=Lachnoclostridium sp. Marseille-P6806 TaxID=2364793 RepID=UPI0010315587|nr:2-hydroxyacid dehydrogenase [Lachnoclostridium sp. Marseille-P6806]
MRIAFYDTKAYDKEYFDRENSRHGYEIVYHEEKLNPKTAVFARGAEAVCAFVNDDLGEKTLRALVENGVQLVALRCAGYNNVDFRYAYNRIHVVRVPAYSPYAVAEHAAALLLTLNRHLNRAYNRTRDFNFSLVGLTGFDLHGKTAGVIGTGKIGRCFIDIMKGFGMNVLAYDPYPAKNSDLHYVGLDELLAESDVISIHCPLTKDNYHLINAETIAKMKPGVYLVNTSRGGLIDSEALLDGLLSGRIGGAGLDVYEEEADMFYEDNSGKIIADDVLARLLSLPNVLLTSHQAFLTRDALENIAGTTLGNIDDFFAGRALANEVCYKCDQEPGACTHEKNGRCF